MFKKLFVLVASLFMFFAVAYAQKKTVAVPTSNEHSVQEVARKLLAGNFDIDPAHTRVSFIVPHLMILLTLLGVGASIIAAFILIRSISKALTTVASEIDTSSTEITNVSRVISTLGNSLEAGSSKQASSIEGISSAVEELSAVVKKNVEYSDNAAEIANESKNAATVGSQVVGEEVGKLAQLSGNSAQEISSMLEQSSQKVEAIVMETQNRVANLVEIGKGKVNAGVKVAHECESVLSQIVEKVSTVTGMADEISLSSKEQSIGFEQISKNVFEMDAIIKQNSTLANQTAKTLGTLNEQSHEMRSSFESLSRLIKGA